MEMEFKDNSRRRTLVLVVGVILALGAGAAAFMLSSQGTDDQVETIPTRNIVVAAELIPARQKIIGSQLTIRAVPRDATNEDAYTDPNLVEGKIAAVPILANQPITDNLLASAVGVGRIDILKEGETVAPDSPVLRAVSLTVPPDRAVGGLIAEGQRVDLIATFPISVRVPLDPDTGEPIEADETGGLLPYVEGASTKLMWLDVEVIGRPEDNPELYIVRMDLQTSEEVAHAQNQGAQFTMVLRPATDTRDVDRHNYGETTDTLLTRYNFRVPEAIDGVEYEQPLAYPSPFPAEPYLSPAPSLSPEPALIEIPVDETEPEQSPLP